MTATGGRIALSEHIDITWLADQTARALCPNCGLPGEVQQILDIDYRPPVEHDDEHRFILQICPHCSARFVDNMKMMEFHSEQQVERGEDAFHVQLGAGLWPIAGQIARLAKPPGARVLEIGGAYGFGLDFALRAKGWTGEGYDPSPFAAVGKAELGLPLHQDYFTVRHLELGPWDVAIATELLEHVSYPAAFLLLMRRALGNEGVLLLSTPNAERVTPDLPVSSLLPLLSPGSHTVMQTPHSLERALNEAGFAHTHIIADGLSLIAYASAAPISLIEDEAARRAMYRTYLVERASQAALTSDLRLGFAGRGIFEAVNDGDWAGADAAWAALLPAARERFGLDLENLASLPAGAAAANLAALSRMMPLALGMILFGRAMRLLEAGQSRVRLEPMLQLALKAVQILLRALAQHSLQDALSASLADLLKTELLICAATAGRMDAVPGLMELGDEETSWRGFVELVNAGAIEAAAALKATLPDLPGARIQAGLRRNALLNLVNFHLAAGGDALQAMPSIEALRSAGETVDEALLGVFIRLVNARRHEAAQAMAERHDIPALVRRHAGQTAAQDAAMAQAMLTLALGDPADIAASLAELPLAPAQKQAVLLEAFVRLVNAGRYETARAFSAAQDVPALLTQANEQTARSILLAQITLELEIGDPAVIPARLAQLALAPAQREPLLLQAFARLVHAGRYEEARDFAGTHNVPAMLNRPNGRAATDAAVSFVLLELASGDPAKVPALLRGLEIPPAQSESLRLQAFTKLVNAARYADARQFAADHDVPGILGRRDGIAAADAAISRAVLELAEGDPALVPGLLTGHEISEERRTDLVLAAFTGLVNYGRHDEAETLAAAESLWQRLDQLTGAAAADARWAALTLDLQRGRALQAARTAAARAAQGGDPARLAGIYADAFIRLVNEGNFPAARELAEDGRLDSHLALCPPPVQLDALTSQLILDVQPGSGAVHSTPARLNALQAAGLDEARLSGLRCHAFSMLVNQSEFVPARALLPALEPELIKLKPPFTPAARDVLFAAGIFYLQHKDDWRRGAATFARLRDGLIKQTPPGQDPDPLFWPALRGEVVTLHQLNRGAEVIILLRSFLDAYPGAPDDLREQLKGVKA